MHRHRTAGRLALRHAAGAGPRAAGRAPAAATPGCPSRRRRETDPGLPLQTAATTARPPETTLAASTTPNAAGSPDRVDDDLHRRRAGHRRRPRPLRSRVPAGRPGAGARLARLHQSRDVRRRCPTPRPAATSSRPAPSTSATAPATPTARCCRPRWPTPPTSTRRRRRSPGARTRERRSSSSPARRTTSSTPTQPVVTGSERADPAQQQRARLDLRVPRQRPGRRLHRRSVGAARRPRAGRHRFTARSIDRAGNASAWSEPIEFFVPRDLTRQRGWTKVTRRRLLPRRRRCRRPAAEPVSCCPGRRSASSGCSPPTGPRLTARCASGSASATGTSWTSPGDGRR